MPLNENIATKKRKALSITGEIQDLVNYKKKNNNKNKKVVWVRKHLKLKLNHI